MDIQRCGSQPASCGAGIYCPNQPNTRGKMAVFITKTFGLQLKPYNVDTLQQNPFLRKVGRTESLRPRG